MKISMKNSEANSSNSNNKIRIAVFGQHDVGKSALTVRYLTRRYIGEYKSNTDLLYRQTLSISHNTSLDIEIVDISTNEECPESSERKTFPVEELHRADGFVIVYSITNRSSFTFALEALSDIYNAYPPQNPTPSTSSQNLPQLPPKSTCPVILIANKNDLEHLREVDKAEGISASMQYGCQFYELSVAENSPLVYQSFQSIVTTLIGQSRVNHSQPKRKFSVSKMLGTLRLGRTSPSASAPIATAPASIVDTNVFTNSTSPSSSSPAKSRESSPFSLSGGKGVNHQRQGSNSSSDTGSNSSSSSNLTSSICHLKSKLVELHSMTTSHNSPPICSL